MSTVLYSAYIPPSTWGAEGGGSKQAGRQRQAEAGRHIIAAAACPPCTLLYVCMYVHLLDREWQLVGMQCDPSFPGFRGLDNELHCSRRKTKPGKRRMWDRGGIEMYQVQRICVPHPRSAHVHCTSRCLLMQQQPVACFPEITNLGN